MLMRTVLVQERTIRTYTSTMLRHCSASCSGLGMLALLTVSLSLRLVLDMRPFNGCLLHRYNWVTDLLILCNLCVQKAHDKSIAALICTDDNLFSSSFTVIKVLFAFSRIMILSVFAFSLHTTFWFFWCMPLIDSRPSDHYFRSVCWFVCAEFLSAVFDPILIKLAHLLYVWV